MRWLVAVGVAQVDTPRAGAVLRPGAPIQVHVEPGAEQRFRFECEGAAADVQIWLDTYCQDCDPLLLLRKGVEDPGLLKQDDNSFERWQEDKEGHYVQASEVGPEGGTVAVFNMNHFADSALTGDLSIECSEIVAFDFLFWDHVKEPLCPRTQPRQPFCSGHGTCSKAGDCVCDDHHIGQACESRKDDVTVAAQGSFPVQMRDGEFRFFKVRVPEHFPGGVLDVHVTGKVPMAVFVRDKKAPTKSHWDFSNFADWVQGKLDTRLIVDLPAVDEPEYSGGSPGAPAGHSAWSERRLAQCAQAELGECEDQCMNCVKAVSGAHPNPASCRACEQCMPTLVACGPTDCSAGRPQGCSTECHACMHCVHSNDARCGDCNQCETCFPWAAKCGSMSGTSVSRDHYFFVGVYNHKRYYHERIEETVQVEIKVEEGIRAPEPEGWVAKVWNPYRTLNDLHATPPFGGPDGSQEQSVFKARVPHDRVLELDVNLFADRPTLVHLREVNRNAFTVIQFPPSILSLGNVTVLSARNSRPKTMFDFDQVHNAVTDGHQVRIVTQHSNGLWLAIFAERAMHDVLLTVSLSDRDALGNSIHDDGRSVHAHSAMVLAETITVFAVTILALYACLSRYARSLQRSRLGHEEEERLHYPSSPLSGERIDQHTEQRHMHRGGLGGDDGI